MMPIPTPKNNERREEFISPENVEMTAPIDIQAAAAEPGAETRLPRFSMLAYSGAAMRLNGWRYPVVVDLAGLDIPDQNCPIRMDHEANRLVGHSERIAIESNQLFAEGVLSFAGDPEADRVIRSAKNGFHWKASIGARVEKFDFVPEGKNVIVNGRTFSGPVYVVRKATLGEISFVDLGADGATSATLAAKANNEEVFMDEQNEVTQNAETAAQTPPAETPPPVVEASATTPSPAPDPVVEMREKYLAEQTRIEAIRKLCSEEHTAIAAQAIRDGWDATKCELEVLRASRPKAPSVHTPDNTLTGSVLEAACMITAKHADVEKLYPEKTLDLAAKRFRSCIGLQELLLEAAWANGYTGRNCRDTRAVLRAAFGHDVQAGFSTINIGGILSNVANKFLLDGFFSVERVWRNICAVRNVSDFKTVASYRLIGKDQYEIVAPGGEIKHGTLGEERYTNKADTYGLLLNIDRRDMINDDLGAITTVPRKLGRGSGLKINDVFWTAFMNNAAFFAAANKNYLDGADTVLGIEGLTKAEVAFLDQVDSDGKPIGVMPAILLVPTALSAMGTQLWKSLEIRDTTASTKYPVANPHQGKFRVEVSRYLSNSHYTGNSAKAWYLLSDAADLPVIEVAFLNGQEAPTIETAEANFNVLGIQMRGFHDFGVSLQDPRGGVKVKGEA